MELFGEQKRCLDCLVSSIEQLGGRVDVPKLEQIAELIIQTMRGPWRYFHTSEHIFEVGSNLLLRMIQIALVPGIAANF